METIQNVGYTTRRLLLIVFIKFPGIVRRYKH